jgi:hypothetical protein
MGNRKLTPELAKKMYSEIFSSKEKFTKGGFRNLLNQEPTSESCNVRIHYLTGGMEIENPGITEDIKTKVDETFQTSRHSKFDFLGEFSELILFMAPIMPLFDKKMRYAGIGTNAGGWRIDKDMVFIDVHGNYLLKGNHSFQGILAHELSELRYSEQDGKSFDKFTETLVGDTVEEIAMDERVYAINPSYCIEMQQITLDHYFKLGAKNSDPLFIGIHAPAIYLPLLKHQSLAGKHLRKRVLDVVRGIDPKIEILSLSCEKVYSKIPLYSPTKEDYSRAIDSIKFN